MRIDVTALRFGFAIVNIVALGLVCWIGYAFFLGERDELTMAMPNPNEFKVKERKRAAVQSGDLRKVISTIYRTKPVPRTVTKPTTPAQDLPAAQGGPLAAEWELISVYAARGQLMASIQKKSITSTTSSSRSSRSSRSKRSTRPTRPSRTSSKSTAKMPRRGPVQPTKYLVTGKEFLVGGKWYDCEKIEFEPKRVYYRDAGRLYSLEPIPVESRLSVGPEGIVLDGIPLDSDEAALETGVVDEVPGAIDFPGKAATTSKAQPTSRVPTKGTRKKVTREETKAISEAMKKAGTADKEALRKALRDLEKKPK